MDYDESDCHKRTDKQCFSSSRRHDLIMVIIMMIWSSWWSSWWSQVVKAGFDLTAISNCSGGEPEAPCGKNHQHHHHHHHHDDHHPHLGEQQEFEWKKVNFDRIWSFAKIFLSSNQLLLFPYPHHNNIVVLIISGLLGPWWWGSGGAVLQFHIFTVDLSRRYFPR